MLMFSSWKGRSTGAKAATIPWYFSNSLLAVQLFALAGTSSRVFASSLDWAYSAIEELGRGGHSRFEISGTPNRNQAALLIARLLGHLSGEDRAQSRRFGVSQNVYLDSMIFSYNQGWHRSRLLM